MSQEKVTITELKALMDARKVTVLDVRSVEEFEEGHIWEALHRPLDSIPDSVCDLPKNCPVVTVCNKGGGRSERAAAVLRNAGWKNARWLESGYMGWVEAGFPDYEPGFASS
jgi:hydroxyacylglutathione hydrolase